MEWDVLAFLVSCKCFGRKKKQHLKGDFLRFSAVLTGKLIISS